jgi:hypothetical protein
MAFKAVPGDRRRPHAWAGKPSGQEGCVRLARLGTGTGTGGRRTQTCPLFLRPRPRLQRHAVWTLIQQYRACLLWITYPDRSLDRLMARLGLLDDALPMFGSVSALPRAGVLLAIPALVQSGIFDCAQKVYGHLRFQTGRGEDLKRACGGRIGKRPHGPPANVSDRCNLKDAMKDRYWLIQRKGVFYLQDSSTAKKESLRTKDRSEADHHHTFLMPRRRSSCCLSADVCLRRATWLDI